MRALTGGEAPRRRQTFATLRHDGATVHPPTRRACRHGGFCRQAHGPSPRSEHARRGLEASLLTGRRRLRSQLPPAQVTTSAGGDRRGRRAAPAVFNKIDLVGDPGRGARRRRCRALARAVVSRRRPEASRTCAGVVASSARGMVEGSARPLRSPAAARRDLRRLRVLGEPTGDGVISACAPASTKLRAAWRLWHPRWHEARRRRGPASSRSASGLRRTRRSWRPRRSSSRAADRSISLSATTRLWRRRARARRRRRRRAARSRRPRASAPCS